MYHAGAMTMLYFQLGWASFTAIAVLILMMPVQVRLHDLLSRPLSNSQWNRRVYSRATRCLCVWGVMHNAYCLSGRA